MNRTMGTRILTVFILAALILCNLFVPVSAEDTNKETVKVAYFDAGNYYQKLSSGNIKSYDADYLGKIEEYSNLKFEYVNCKTWDQALKLLENKKVDLVGTMQWTLEREDKYEFCLENYGYTVGEIAALPSKKMIYEDYDAIGKSTIGYTKGYVRRDDMKSELKEHNISPKYKVYDNQQELLNALKSGEIDLIASNSHIMDKNLTVVEKNSYSPFYFVSWKGNEKLSDKMDQAIISINLGEPNFDDQLMKQYFPSILGGPLTKEEMNLINKHKTYEVYMNAETKPLSWYDAETKSMKGALVEICKQVSKNTGLKIKPMPIFNSNKRLANKKNTTTTLYDGLGAAVHAGDNITNALVDEEFNFYYKKKNIIDLKNDSCTVAVVKNRAQLKKYIKTINPNVTFKEYISPSKCLKAVQNGQVDLAYLDSRIADNTILEKGLKDVVEFPINPEKQGIALVFQGEDGPMLADIVDKGLEQVDQYAISNLFIRYALDTQEPFSQEKLFKKYFKWIVLGIIVIILALLGMAITFTYANVMKKQKDKIAKANADRTEFFSRVSHDMRTPMNGILGMLRLSEESKDVTELHDNINKAKAAGEYMLSLINDTLDLQRIESKKLVLEKDVVNVAEYYDGIFRIMKIEAEQEKINFEIKYINIERDNYIVLDSVRMKQILSNLISNAIKFTPEGGAIKVIVESLGRSGDVLHRKYQVIDTGVGMSQDFLDNQLFKPYAQESNSLSTKLVGSGLGMAITKNLVEIMDGHIEVESVLGEGTTFTVYLDIQQASPEALKDIKKEKEEDSKAVEINLRGKKVLMCEDHPLNAEISKKLLDKVGCQVVWAKDGVEGVRKFKESRQGEYNAVLMDIRMPEMDGLEAANTIRCSDHPDAKTIPIIAMSANAYKEDIDKSLAAGMNEHLAKPINPQQMYHILAKYM